MIAPPVMGPVLGALASTDQDERWADLIEAWRSLGPWLWLLAAGAGALWFLAYGLVLAATDPRRVAPGPSTLDLGGPEPPAVVNLITQRLGAGPHRGPGHPPRAGRPGPPPDRAAGRAARRTSSAPGGSAGTCG